MRPKIALTLLATALALQLAALDVLACSPWSGGITEDCLRPLTLSEEGAELYAVKISGTGGGTTLGL